MARIFFDTLPEIDTIPKFTLAGFRPLLDGLRKQPPEVLELIRTHPEGWQRMADSLQKDYTATIDYERWGLRYTITPEVTITAEVGNVIVVDGLRFEWEKDGNEFSVYVKLVQRPSNLGIGTVDYFVCPYTNKLCRQLYTVCGTICSGWAFKHTYSRCNRSHSKKAMLLDAFVDIATLESTHHRKEYYRGNITPYGKRMLKLCQRCNSKDLLKELQKVSRL